MSNKGEATWHPNNGPVTDHADLIGRLRGVRSQWGSFPLLDEAADALAALSDSVRHESYRQLHDQHEATRGWREKAEHERDEARAELKSLHWAHVLAPHDPWCEYQLGGECGGTCWKAGELAKLEARHDAEVKAQALDEAAASIEGIPGGRAAHVTWLRNRAATLRDAENS